MDDFQAYLGSLVEQETPQMCMLCGIFFKNAISFQYHMRAHAIYTGPTPEQLLGVKNLNLPGTSGGILAPPPFDGRNIANPGLSSLISEAKPVENRSNPTLSVNMPDFSMGLPHLPASLLESQTFDGKNISGPLSFDGKNVPDTVPFGSKNIERTVPFDGKNVTTPSTFDGKNVSEPIPFGSKSVDRSASFDDKSEAGPLPFESGPVDRTVNFDSKNVSGPIPFNGKNTEHTSSFDTKSIAEPITSHKEQLNTKSGKSRSVINAPDVTDFPSGMSGLPTMQLNVLDFPNFRHKDVVSSASSSEITSIPLEMKNNVPSTDIPDLSLGLPSLPTNALEALAFGCGGLQMPPSNLTTGHETKTTDVHNKTTANIFGNIPDFSMAVLAPQPNVIEHQTFGGREATVPINSNMTEPKSAEITNKTNTTEHIPDYTMTPNMLEALIAANKEAYKDVTMGLIDSKTDNKETSSSAQPSTSNLQTNPTGGIGFQGTQFFNSLTQQYLAPNTLNPSGSSNQNSFNASGNFPSSTTTQPSAKKFDLFDNTNSLDMISIDEFKHEPISSDDEIEELLNECKAMGERSMNEMQPDLLKADIDTLSDISDIGEDRYTHLTEDKPQANQQQSLTNDIAELFEEDVPKLVPMVENNIVISKPAAVGVNFETTSTNNKDDTDTDASKVYTTTTSSVVTVSSATTTVTTARIAESKQDEPDNDFSLENIPTVGKFMKIKKYLQSYEHKKNEQKQCDVTKPSTSEQSTSSSHSANKVGSLSTDEKDTLKQAIKEINERRQKSEKAKRKPARPTPIVSDPQSQNLRTRRQIAAAAEKEKNDNVGIDNKSSKAPEGTSESHTVESNVQKRKSEPHKVVVKSCKVVITDTIKKDLDLAKVKKDESPQKKKDNKDDAAVSAENIIKDTKKEADRILTRNARNRQPESQKVTPPKRKSDEHKKVSPSKDENNSLKKVDQKTKDQEDSQKISTRSLQSRMTSPPTTGAKKKVKSSPVLLKKPETEKTENIQTRSTRKSNRGNENKQQNTSELSKEPTDTGLKSFISLQVEEVRKLREKSPGKIISDDGGSKSEISTKDTSNAEVISMSEHLTDDALETFSETASILSVSMSNQEVQDNFDRIDELCKNSALAKPPETDVTVTKIDMDLLDTMDDTYEEMEDISSDDQHVNSPEKEKAFVDEICVSIPNKPILYSSEDSGNEVNDSYVGQAVEPLKLKLFKIKPVKEKKHHKKKKKKDKKEKKRPKIKLKIKKSRIIEVEPVVIDPYSFSDNEDLAQGKKPKSYEKKHACEWCGQAFGQKCDLTKHVMIHTGERPWPCNTCDKRFQRKTDLVKHTRIHTGEKPYECEYCGKRVSDKSQLNVHRRLHTGDRPYSCDVCSKGCITSSELNRHRITHFNERPWHCEICGKSFKLKDNLSLHMKIHYGTKKFKCDVCNLGFDRLDKKERHMKLHESETPYMCHECGQEFSKLPLYANHIRCHKREHPPFVCHYCDKQFDCKSNYEPHLRSHTKEKPFKCDICGSAFSLKGNLKHHLKTHGDDKERIYLCEKCPETFRLKRELEAHKRHHLDEENLHCGVCNTTFPDLPALVAHRQAAHPQLSEEFDVDDTSYIMDIMDKELLKNVDHGRTNTLNDNRENCVVPVPRQIADKNGSVASRDTIIGTQSSLLHNSNIIVSGKSSAADNVKTLSSIPTDDAKSKVDKVNSLEANYTHTLRLLTSSDKERSSELVVDKTTPIINTTNSSAKKGANSAIKRLLTEDIDIPHSESFKSNNGSHGSITGVPLNKDNGPPPVKRSRKRPSQVPIFERKQNNATDSKATPSSYSWTDAALFNASDYVNSLMESSGTSGGDGDENVSKYTSPITDSNPSIVNASTGQTKPDKNSPIKYVKTTPVSVTDLQQRGRENAMHNTSAGRTSINDNINQNTVKSVFSPSQPDKQLFTSKFIHTAKSDSDSLQSSSYLHPPPPLALAFRSAPTNFQEKPDSFLVSRSAPTNFPEKSDSHPVSRSAMLAEKSDFPEFTNFASIPSLARNFEEFASSFTGFHSEEPDKGGQPDRGDDMAALFSHFDYSVNH